MNTGTGDGAGRPGPGLPGASPSAEPRVERPPASAAAAGREPSGDVAWLAEPGRAWRWLGLGLAAWLVTVPVRWGLGEEVHLFYETGLLYLVATGLLGPAFIRARRLALRFILDRHAAGDPVFEPLYEHFLNRVERGWRPVVAGWGTAGLFLGFRLAVSWELLPYHGVPARLVVTLLGAIACGLFVRALWHLLGFGVLVSGMSRELEERGGRMFSLELLERAGAGYARTAFGASFLSLGLFWLVMGSRALVMDRPADLAETLPAMIGVLLLALVVPLAYLVVPIWRLHRIMAQRKEEIRRLFAGEHADIERRFLEQPDREMAHRYLTGRQVIQEIENLPEWPFRVETLAKLVTLVAVPAGLFICKEIVVDVVVELLKRP
ncbi:MAG: hypothetical protein GX442_21510 [Candidatus Riflebacteria bacterium]|nr:hypothetical protein [Candidatus Riflebacteria bacterium]